MIKVLQQHEEPCHLDLQQLPLSSEELKLLGDILGEGSVHAEVEHIGVSRIYATSIPSVWRVIHFDNNDEVLSDFLEVSYCPEIIITPDDEIPVGLELLKAKIFEIGMKGRKVLNK